MKILGVKFDPKLTLVIIVGTLMPLIDMYDHTIFKAKSYDRFVFYFIVPVLVIRLVFKEPMKDFGFQWGNWKEGLAWTVGVCAVMTCVLLVVARRPEMVNYYKSRAAAGYGQAVWHAAVDLFGWEFIWRGFSLFALARVLGPGPAIWLQAVPFTFAHVGKPELETLSCLFGGAGFGIVAWRSRSFVYCFLIHLFITSFTIWAAMTASV